MKLLNSILKVMPNALTQNGSRAALLMQKYSPEILTGLGIAAGATSAFLACRATLKVNDILNEHDRVVSDIEEAETHEEYSEQDSKTDRIKLKLQTGGKLVRLYAPSLMLGAASVGCILGGKHILTKRNAALAAAYTVVEGTLNDYRKRVVDQFGEEKDKELFYGLKSQTVLTTEYDEDGKKHKSKKTVNFLDPTDISQYARFYDDASPNWSDEPEYNLLFLKNQQNYCNDLLHSRGHLFLNEVYDILGIPRSQAGAVVGWVLKKGNDNFVDFGIYSIRNQEAIDFVNGYESSILLDFNVDGVIFDLI